MTQTLRIPQVLGDWSADQLHAYLKANAAGFEGMTTMQGRDEKTGELVGEISLLFADSAMLPDGVEIENILASPPPSLPVPVSELDALKARLDKLESDVSILKGA